MGVHGNLYRSGHQRSGDSDARQTEPGDLQRRKESEAVKGDKYYPPYTIKGDGWVARVHRPILTPEERKKRMQKIHDMAALVLMERERAHASDN